MNIQSLPVWTPLSREEIKDLEHNTTPIENIWNGVCFLLPTTFPYNNKPFGAIQRLRLVNKKINLLGWYHKQGLTTRTPIKDHWKKMTQLLGYAPSCYPVYEYRNALWGFEWENNKVLLYYSIKGLSIQVPTDFNKKKVEKLIDFLIHKLRRK